MPYSRYIWRIAFHCAVVDSLWCVVGLLPFGLALYAHFQGALQVGFDEVGDVSPSVFAVTPKISRCVYDYVDTVVRQQLRDIDERSIK